MTATFRKNPESGLDGGVGSAIRAAASASEHHASNATLSSAASGAALEVSGLSHSFGARKALQDVSFAIWPGEFTVLLGLNGAGKTTLFSLITRLYDHRSGTIRVFGAEVKTAPSLALSRMGIVFQQPTLDLDLTVEQNLKYHAALHGMAPRVARERIEREVVRLELQERLRDKVRQLSGGQRRRVEIARALLHDPDLLLLDEPTVGLDIASRQFLLDHVRQLCRTQGIAVLWATHLIDEIDEMSRVIVLHRGRILARSRPADICAATSTKTMREAFDTLTREAPA